MFGNQQLEFTLRDYDGRIIESIKGNPTKVLSGLLDILEHKLGANIVKHELLAKFDRSLSKFKDDFNDDVERLKLKLQ